MSDYSKTDAECLSNSQIPQLDSLRIQIKNQDFDLNKIRRKIGIGGITQKENDENKPSIIATLKKSAFILLCRAGAKFAEINVIFNTDGSDKACAALTFPKGSEEFFGKYFEKNKGIGLPKTEQQLAAQEFNKRAMALLNAVNQETRQILVTQWVPDFLASNKEIKNVAVVDAFRLVHASGASLEEAKEILGYSTIKSVRNIFNALKLTPNAGYAETKVATDKKIQKGNKVERPVLVRARK